MQKIEQQTLDTVLEPYSKPARYLKEAKQKYPKAQGTFYVPKPIYVCSTGHLNAADLIICYNQLAYALFAESGRLGRIPDFGFVTLNEFKKLQLKNSVITRMNDVHFRRFIDETKAFQGRMEVHAIKKMNKTHLFRTSYDFEQGKATGKTDLVLIR